MGLSCLVVVVLQTKTMFFLKKNGFIESSKKLQEIYEWKKNV